MSKHTVQDTEISQTFYVTDAKWTAKPAQFSHPNDTFHLGARKVYTSFLTSELELKPKHLKSSNAFGDFRVTGDLSVTDKKAILMLTSIELILRKDLDGAE